MAAKHPVWGVIRKSRRWSATTGTRQVSTSTVFRILDEETFLLKVDYQRQHRHLAQQRKAAFTDPPTGPNMV